MNNNLRIIPEINGNIAKLKGLRDDTTELCRLIAIDAIIYDSEIAIAYAYYNYYSQPSVDDINEHVKATNASDITGLFQITTEDAQNEFAEEATKNLKVAKIIEVKRNSLNSYIDNPLVKSQYEKLQDMYPIPVF